MKLMETFADQVPDTNSGFSVGYYVKPGNTSSGFSVGYYVKPGNAKRWIESSDDLEAMYTLYPHDNTITLWCDGKPLQSLS